MKRETRFICVEVCIKTDSDSDDFVSYFEAEGHFVQKHPSEDHKWYIYFDPTPYKDANITIQKMCEMIEGLPSVVRNSWDNAAQREFYAGYEVGETPQCFQEHIDLKTLKACVKVGAGIGYALYPASIPDESS